jgi:Flp pilus assembly protein TadG
MMRVTETGRSRAGRNRRGTSSVELAMIVPVMLTVALACVDLGRFAYNFIAVSNAARAGAGYAMMNTYTAATQSAYLSKVQQAVTDEMTGQTGFNSANLTVNVSLINEGSGDTRVQVAASYPFQTVVTWPGIPHNLTLQRTVAMRKIR